MPWAQIISGGAGLLGGLIGGNADSNAAKQLAQYYQQAEGFDKGIYNTAQSNLSPYISTGGNALYSLASLYGLNGAQAGNGANAAYQNYTQTPAYQNNLNQGELGVNRSLAAQGLTLSGAQSKDLANYAQNYASGQFGNYVGQLQSLAGLGQQSSLGLGSLGSSLAGNLNSTLFGQGNALSAGGLGQTQSQLGGIASLLSALTSGGNASASSSFTSSPLGQGASWLSNLANGGVTTASTNPWAAAGGATPTSTNTTSWLQ